MPPRLLDDALLAGALSVHSGSDTAKRLRLLLWLLAVALLDSFAGEGVAAAAALLSLAATRCLLQDALLQDALQTERRAFSPPEALPARLAALVHSAGVAVDASFGPRLEVTDLGVLVLARATWPLTGSETVFLGILGDWHCISQAGLSPRLAPGGWIERAVKAAERAARDAAAAVR